MVEMGFDLDAFMDQTLGYSQSNGTIELRERLAALYPGAGVDEIEVTNGTSRSHYLIAPEPAAPGGRGWRWKCRTTCRCPRSPQPRRDGPDVQPAAGTGWEPDWDEFRSRSYPRTRLLYLSNPNNPTGSVLSASAMERILRRSESTGTWILADEVYLGAEIDRERTTSFWGMSDRVIVTSGLSKAYGIPGIRVGWMVGPRSIVDECWSQQTT